MDPCISAVNWDLPILDLWNVIIGFVTLILTFISVFNLLHINNNTKAAAEQGARPPLQIVTPGVGAGVGAGVGTGVGAGAPGAGTPGGSGNIQIILPEGTSVNDLAQLLSSINSTAVGVGTSTPIRPNPVVPTVRNLIPTILNPTSIPGVRGIASTLEGATPLNA